MRSRSTPARRCLQRRSLPDHRDVRLGLQDGTQAAVAVLVGALLFAWLVPARANRHSTGLVFAVVSIPLLWAFWSALPLLVPVAAILLAATHRSTGGPTEAGP